MSTAATLDRALPHSEESERAVLAAVMLSPEALPQIAGRLVPEDLYFERHQRIYDAMLALQVDQTTIDLRTLQAALQQRNQLDKVGGLAYLAGLDVDLPDVGRLDQYVEIVKERSLRRRLMAVCNEVTKACLDGGLDAHAALGLAEKGVLELGEEAVRKGFSRLGVVLRDTIEELEERPGSTLTGIATGFIDLDRITHGLNRGNLIIIAGRPGMGKTSFAVNVAQHVAIREGKPVGLFSLEMSDRELVMRVLCSETDMSYARLRAGHLSEQQWAQVLATQKRISSAPFFIDDGANPTLLEISSKARRLRAEVGLELLIIDYLQLMQAGGRYENRNLEISAISRGLKQLAKELDIPVIALSQLSRQPERRGGDHRPQLSDLRESGSIEQDADVVMFVYRDELYNKDDPANKGLAELIIGKHRNGETGTVDLVFLGETTSFRNRYRDQAPS